ncbi:MAG: Beta-galactosidase C-terminal domain [Limosilactobacillus mucosae]|nr:Beta-galactosidase C-terminal domain [Limosilactobacillus mucosae]
MERVIDQTGLAGLTSQTTDLEITRRVKNGQELYFVLNLRNESRLLPTDLQQAGFVDILTGAAPKAKLEPWDVEILKRGMDQ